MTGKTVLHYEILEQLGAGGMGVVYRARDTKLDRIVALKFLPKQLSADPKTKERFIQEAKAASALDDPNICTIHDIAEAGDGQLFIVMAFYGGSTLKYLLGKEKLGVEAACSIARQMALGLGRAHDAGIVHRDVKPANIMVTERGLVKVLDFGVAKLGEVSDLTRTGSTIGTAAYMSPEQARGDQLDLRSDIWSIGAVLYEMLSGSRPFTGGYEAAVAYSIINEDPPPLQNIPDDLAAIVGRALSKSPDDRHGSAHELANQLASFAGATVFETRERPAAAGATAPAVQAVVLKFCVLAAVVLGVLYAVMLALGLPDWVFPTGVLLALIGLPIILYGASLDRKRAKLDSAERQRLTGLKSWLTTKRAYQGGILASSGLLLSVVLYVVLRSAGIGPFASLLTGGALNEQDILIIADFQNGTTDASLGVAVTEAFRIDLSQSTAIRLMDRAVVKSALERMQVNPDTILSSGLALEIAEREGAKAVIAGDINAAGAGFILNARILSRVDGTQLAAFRETARSNNDIVDAIDRLSANLREGIGESLVDIRGDKALERVTTSNLNALRLYTEAENLSSIGDEEGGLELLRRVVRLDSTFAMGYRKMAVLMNNLRYPQDSIFAIVEQGYRFRDNLPWQERTLLEAYRAISVLDDQDEMERLYKEVLKRYPYQGIALNNLALSYNGSGRYSEAEPLLRRALENDDAVVFRNNLVRSVTNQGRLDDALVELQKWEKEQPGTSHSASNRVNLEFLQDDFDATEAWVDTLARRSTGDFDQVQVERKKSAFLMAQGKLTQASEHKQAQRKLRSDLFPTRDPNMQQLIDLQRRTGDAADIALLTGDTREFKQLLDEFVAFQQSFESEENQIPYTFLIDALSVNGYPKEAAQWSERFRADLRRKNEEMEERDEVLLAYVGALNGGDVLSAIQRAEEIIGSWGCRRCWRMELGELELLRGNLDRAISQFEQFTSAPDLGAIYADDGRVAVALFQLGGLYEQRGDLDPAISAYTRMAERWKNADAVLQPQVAEARRRIETILDRKAREN